MLQSIKQLYGHKLGVDADIGHIKDFYFDDQDWAVRYLVADTGKWLPGRQVLISPHAVGDLQPVDKSLHVNLTRKQIEDGPAVETHKPVSRQYEESYHRYYGWPYYWEGDGLWGGTRDYPILAPMPEILPAEPITAPASNSVPVDAHLHSAQAVTGYHLQATDGIVGHVCDFMLDDKSWAINQLVIRVGHRFTGKEVQIPVSVVERISYKESTVFVKLAKEAVEKSSVHRLVPNNIVVPAQPAQRTLVL